MNELPGGNIVEFTRHIQTDSADRTAAQRRSVFLTRHHNSRLRHTLELTGMIEPQVGHNNEFHCCN